MTPNTSMPPDNHDGRFPLAFLCLYALALLGCGVAFACGWFR